MQAQEWCWEFDGRFFQLELASDVIRDGMWLEVWEVSRTELPHVSFSVFYSDQTGRFGFRAASEVEVPLELVERIVAEARRRLPRPAG